MTKTFRFAPCASLLLALGLSGCGKPADTPPATAGGPPPTPITTTAARSVALDVTEDTLGTLEALIDPKIAAEVAGRVTRVAVRSGDPVRAGQLLAELDATDFTTQGQADGAEVTRLEALLAQAERFAQRQQDLVARGFISRNGAEDSLTQRDALRAQLANARARATGTRNNLGRTRVAAPTDGIIETQIVSPGDYVKVGDPLFKLVSNRILRAHLPFPESAAQRIRRGQPVRLSPAQAPEQVIEGTVEDIKPTLSESSRAIDVLVRVSGNDSLLSGGTVNGSVVTGRKPAAIVVPEQSVVLRPAGKVVYVIADGKAQQRIIEAGFKGDGRIEVLKGLTEGETVAENGAGFLTDGAAVTVKAPAGSPPPQAAATTGTKP
ncbi:efflux RND transporter periplasmic adaptor subunit [Zoogloea sp.]|uniref:efflux RND transporter periplasmic adaptor subunit n=1 Tax=Zoogloea sp. TaxID=49181 RepID=UPI00261650CA|nr:efflux RND transporter periplasmic adaptor subunit [Zoogloea sp.]MDD3352890.1 efflux RND transporter periplasmic adaptor subunit [Zoogloea sp.]